ncbi:LEAF RUST 10 DISEASE-RESISTANCE LOCUS RECEPTOR-LIKE PROTEIN KINASE-like 2.4 [Fagus crenata]
MASISLFVFFALSHLLLLHSAEEENSFYLNCSPFHCGKFSNISFPFFNSKYPSCGSLLAVNCDEALPTIQLELGGRQYELINIHNTNTTLSTARIKDPSLLDSFNPRNCESLTNLTFPGSPPFISYEITSPNQTLFKCNRTSNSTSPENFKNISCGNNNIYYSHSSHSSPTSFSECSIIQLPRKEHPDKDELFSPVSAEFDLKVHVSVACSSCHGSGGICDHDHEGKFECNYEYTDNGKSENHKNFKLHVGLAGIGVLVIIVCCFWRKFSSITIIWKKETLHHQSVEAFLKNHGPLVIRRYSYSDIKKMTNSFKNKLGQGGYGGVYKGKLQDGCFVAVKVLKELKGDGEEFINEVASISRTSHVNIVTLKGFSFEGSNRALIYEFLHNGSLEKFIYIGNASNFDHQLGWETLYKIAIGIAQGLEYLHRGCNTRILHFDIKPHNILLDENFCPKISNFGLAKICPREKSIIAMVGARETIGYIAPEVFSRSFGGVSHKSDVYSYGMMVLEMVGGRKNIDVSVDCTSEIYFPHWIYKRLELDEELGLQDLLNEADQEGVRKMILVSLWCIQTEPSNRPPMSRVVEMLEGSLDSLQIPPKPFLSSPPRSPLDSSTVMASLQYDSEHLFHEGNP